MHWPLDEPRAHNTLYSSSGIHSPEYWLIQASLFHFCHLSEHVEGVCCSVMFGLSVGLDAPSCLVCPPTSSMQSKYNTYKILVWVRRKTCTNKLTRKWSQPKGSWPKKNQNSRVVGEALDRCVHRGQVFFARVVDILFGIFFATAQANYFTILGSCNKLDR